MKCCLFCTCAVLSSVPQLESEPEVKQIGEAPEDVPFAIPEKWKWISASYVQTLVRGITFPASAKTKMQTHNSICCLTTGSVQEKYASKADAFVDQSFMKNTRQILQVGDVVISSANSKELVGKSILWEDKSGIQKTFGGFLTVARVKDSQSVIPEYLFLVYRYMFKTGYFANLSTQTTNIANLSNKLLDALAFPIPPLGEQQRLVAKLNKLLPLVETYGKEQEALEKLEKEFPDKLRASLLQEAIQGKLVPQLESEPEVTQIGEAPEDVPFAIPEKWRWVRVSDVAHTNPKVTAQTSSTEVSFIPMAALSAGYISQIALDAKRSWGTVKNGYTKFIEGDVLLAKITPCFQNRKSAIAKKLSNGIGCGSSEFHVLRVNENIVTQEYLLMFLKSQWFITYGVENFKGTAGQQRLGTSDLKNCLFPLPPMSEQHRIVAKLNELLDSVKHLEYNVSKT